MLVQVLLTLAFISVLATQSAGFFPSSDTHIQTLSDKQYSLADRYADAFVNTVFDKNILLTLAYMRGAAQTGQPVDWGKVKENFTYTMMLQPGKTYAFHDEVLPQYKSILEQTSNAHFDTTQGFISDGWLVGDGVCHLASFMNVAAKAAGLSVSAPTPHDFAAIPDVSRADGVAIYYSQSDPTASALQNLYITNTFKEPVAFVFTYKNDILDIRVEKLL